MAVIYKCFVYISQLIIVMLYKGILNKNMVKELLRTGGQKFKIFDVSVCKKFTKLQCAIMTNNGTLLGIFEGMFFL